MTIWEVKNCRVSSVKIFKAELASSFRRHAVIKTLLSRNVFKSFFPDVP